MPFKIGFIGLGVMGFPMAGHLQAAGHDVHVYNRTTRQAEEWCRLHGGHLAQTPAQAAFQADFVFSCVGRDEDVRAIAEGADGIFHMLQAGSIYIDHTTTSAALARDLAAMAERQGAFFMDAPVSGGEIGAQKGQLTIMCGGLEETYHRAQPVMNSYARHTKRLGDAGAGQLCKMVNQICVAGLLQALAEGLHFAQQAGLEGQEVIETISKGAAQSWQMENRFETMLEGQYDFGFAVDWMRKDLDICLEEARQNGASLPLTQKVNDYYQQIQKMGGGRWDTSSLIERLRRDSDEGTGRSGKGEAEAQSKT